MSKLRRLIHLLRKNQRMLVRNVSARSLRKSCKLQPLNTRKMRTSPTVTTMRTVNIKPSSGRFQNRSKATRWRRLQSRRAPLTPIRTARCKAVRLAPVSRQISKLSPLPRRLLSRSGKGAASLALIWTDEITNGLFILL